MPPEPFKALKVSSSNASLAAPPSESAEKRADDISSPHELTAFVETLLGQLETRFEDMSTQILDKMTQMSARVDSLESSLQNLINGDTSVPQSPEAQGGSSK